MKKTAKTIIIGGSLLGSNCVCGCSFLLGGRGEPLNSLGDNFPVVFENDCDKNNFYFINKKYWRVEKSKKAIKRKGWAESIAKSLVERKIIRRLEK